jgi:ornithine cyclodeaminase
MRVIDAAEIDRKLAYPALVDVIAAAFRSDVVAPPRHHHTVPRAGAADATWLLMPAWNARYMGVKSVSVFPDNNTRGLPAVMGTYLLASAETGAPLAVFDATRLTVWRTAAASALASRHLSRPDTARMLMIGAGALAPFLIRAHASVRPIRRVTIWNRSRARAEALAAEMSAPGLACDVTDDLEAATRAADLVSTATISSTPLVRGAWLTPGTHVDCVGAFTATMRETDDDVVRRARLYADTFAGAFGEAGDFLIPIAAGVITRDAVLGDLAALERSTATGRTSSDDITMFKSVGASLEDLAAAVAVYERP